MRPRLSLVALLSVLLLGAGCGRDEATRSATAPSESQIPGQRTLPDSVRRSGSLEERRAAFLNRIREADPDKATIERALLNEDNELGLILSRRTNLDDVPKLMRTMLAQLDEAFPGQDHTVVAYAPTEPPRKIGTARLDAKTRDMTYTAATTP